MKSTQQANKQVVLTVIEEVLNLGNFEPVYDLLSDRLVEHDPHQAAGTTAHQSFINAVSMFRTAFPDQRTVVDAQVAEGDRVATRWHMTGTHKGPFMGVEPSGKLVEVTGIFFDTVQDGQIVETWANYDLYGLMQQIS